MKDPQPVTEPVGQNRIGSERSKDSCDAEDDPEGEIEEIEIKYDLYFLGTVPATSTRNKLINHT